MLVKLIVGITLSLSVSAFAADQSVSIPKSIPYAADSDIAGNIKRECAIDAKLADFIAEYANERHIPISLVNQTDASMPGRVLVMEIVDAESSGNAFIGHHKTTKVRGSYFEDSKLVGSFKDRRDSMGGMFAGFKGSCSVIGRTVREIGKDVAEWLAHPVPDAELGDLK